MERAIQFPAKVHISDRPSEHKLGLFSIESVLNLEKLIFAGSPLAEVLKVIARLVESQGESMFCTIWLPDEDGKHLDCVAAPSLPGFSAHVGRILRHSGLSQGAGVRDRHSDRSSLG
jgi:formate hydrogenlyase transcriptional activator